MNKYKEVIFNADEIVDLLLANKQPANTVISEEYKTYNDAAERLGYKKLSLKQNDETESYESFYNKRTSIWFMPENYFSIEVLEYLLNKCNKEVEVERVLKEYKEFKERGLVILLKFFIFLVDHMREHNIVWGVGRGSSVSSYCLYLIGVHRINSLKYNLDINEFLK